MKASLGICGDWWVDGALSGKRSRNGEHGLARLWSVLFCGLTCSSASAAGVVTVAEDGDPREVPRRAFPTGGAGLVLRAKCEVPCPPCDPTARLSQARLVPTTTLAQHNTEAKARDIGSHIYVLYI